MRRPWHRAQDAGLNRKVLLLQTASSRCPAVLEPLDALAEYGGFELRHARRCDSRGGPGTVASLIIDGFHGVGRGAVNSNM